MRPCEVRTESIQATENQMGGGSPKKGPPSISRVLGLNDLIFSVFGFDGLVCRQKTNCTPPANSSPQNFPIAFFEFSVWKQCEGQREIFAITVFYNSK